MLKKPAMLFLGAALAAAMAFGLVRLFEIRFQGGDIYPPYSSLRADPLGASVLFESLELVPGVKVRRYFDPVWRIEDGRRGALLILGMPAYGLDILPPSEFATLNQFLVSGGRIVLAFRPEVIQTHDTQEAARTSTEQRNAMRQNPSDRMKRQTNNFSADSEWVDLSRQWGFFPQFHNLLSDNDGKPVFPVAQLAAENADLPDQLDVHTALYFANLDDAWSVVYERDSWPVLAERHFGKGSVIIAADSYWLSNEALSKGADPRLLSWLMGGGRDIVFDEAHLGVAENSGVAKLMRKYHLDGLVFSLLLVAALFIWKSAFALAPPYEENPVSGGQVAVAGRDSIAGFINLLRRVVPPAGVLAACLDEWKKTPVRASAGQQRQVERLIREQEALPPRQRNPAQTYRDIAEILRRKTP